MGGLVAFLGSSECVDAKKTFQWKYSAILQKFDRSKSFHRPNRLPLTLTTMNFDISSQGVDCIFGKFQSVLIDVT